MMHPSSNARRTILTFLSVFFLEAVNPAQAVPGKSMASEIIQNEAESNILLYDYSITVSNCQSRKIIDTKILGTPENMLSSPAPEKLSTGSWRERWYLDRCGKIIFYDITYTPNAKGGMNFFFKDVTETILANKIELEPDDISMESKGFTKKIVGTRGTAAQTVPAYTELEVKTIPVQYRIVDNGFMVFYRSLLFEGGINRAYINPRALISGIRTGFGAGINNDTAMAFSNYHIESGFNSVIPSISPAEYVLYTGRALESSGFQISLGYALYSGSADGFGYFASIRYEILRGKDLRFGAAVFGDYLFAQVPQNGTFNIFELRIPVYAGLSF